MDPIQKPERKWYQKKRWILGLSVAAIFIIGLANSSPVPQPAVKSSTQAVTPQPALVNKAIQPTQPIPAPTRQTNTLSNDNYYTNVSGNTVHAPAYSTSAPEGASAQCRDGTYSFSQHRSGTCSHHGGVASWL